MWTDHKPLTHVLHRVSDPWTAKQQRQLSYVAEYTSNLCHVPGVENVVADALSRPPSSSPALGVNHVESPAVRPAVAVSQAADISPAIKPSEVISQAVPTCVRSTNVLHPDGLGSKSCKTSGKTQRL